jgi:translation initiation factor IF-2
MPKFDLSAQWRSGDRGKPLLRGSRPPVFSGQQIAQRIEEIHDDREQVKQIEKKLKDAIDILSLGRQLRHGDGLSIVLHDTSP